VACDAFFGRRMRLIQFIRMKVCARSRLAFCHPNSLIWPDGNLCKMTQTAVLGRPEDRTCDVQEAPLQFSPLRVCLCVCRLQDMLLGCIMGHRGGGGEK
jgi:hypothetical protein